MEDAYMFTGQGVELYRLLTYRRGLALEAKGMRLTRGRTITAQLKERYQLPRNAKRDRVSEMLEAEIASIQGNIKPGEIKKV